MELNNNSEMTIKLLELESQEKSYDMWKVKVISNGSTCLLRVSSKYKKSIDPEYRGNYYAEGMLASVMDKGKLVNYIKLSKSLEKVDRNSYPMNIVRLRGFSFNKPFKKLKDKLYSAQVYIKRNSEKGRFDYVNIVSDENRKVEVGSDYQYWLLGRLVSRKDKKSGRDVIELETPSLGLVKEVDTDIANIIESEDRLAMMRDWSALLK